MERVRAKLGRVCSHPRAIEVHAIQGTVTLQGPILARELDHVLRSVANVRGVRGVASELEAHEDASHVPALQGEGKLAGSELDLLQPNWAPASQALVTVAGLAATGIVVAAVAARR